MSAEIIDRAEKAPFFGCKIDERTRKRPPAKTLTPIGRNNIAVAVPPVQLLITSKRSQVKLTWRDAV